MKIKGFLRPDGSYGIRNHILVLPSVICSFETAKRIAEGVPGAVTLGNQAGCAQAGKDKDQTIRTLAGFGSHPNVAAVLVVGLGCESVDPLYLADLIRKTGKPVQVLVIQEEGGTQKTIAKGKVLLQQLKDYTDRCEREDMGINHLILGVECGGSDTTSGLAANPVAGFCSDLLVKMGGTTYLSETPEIIGAEHLLAKRAVSPEVGEQILATVANFEARLKSYGVDFRGAQPTPGNIAGGLTSIEEKSLGAIHKSGTTPISGVLDYGEKAPKPGHFLMDSPGYDIESITGMIAGGAHVIIFTTGQGTPVGSPIAPVIKVCANPQTVAMMGDNIDLDASPVILGSKTIEEIGRDLFSAIIEVSNGDLTRAEHYGFQEFAINRIGCSF